MGKNHISNRWSAVEWQIATLLGIIGVTIFFALQYWPLMTRYDKILRHFLITALKLST